MEFVSSIDGIYLTKIFLKKNKKQKVLILIKNIIFIEGLLLFSPLILNKLDEINNLNIFKYAFILHLNMFGEKKYKNEEDDDHDFPRRLLWKNIYALDIL